MERDELKQWLEESFWSTRTPPTMSEKVGIVQALVELSNAELLATCIGKKHCGHSGTDQTS